MVDATVVVVGSADVVPAPPGVNLFRAARATVEFLLAAVADDPFFFLFFPSVKLGFLL